jgi:hypothetical protein
MVTGWQTSILDYQRPSVAPTLGLAHLGKDDPKEDLWEWLEGLSAP